MPPGSVPIPRFWAPGMSPETNPKESGGGSVAPLSNPGDGPGTNAGSALNRSAVGVSSAVPLIRSGPGRNVESRLVCSIWNRSTCGVNAIPGGKWALIPTAATNPGPRSVEFGSVMFGSESISRWVMVDWLMIWMVREVRGAWLLPKNAPVRALATAPSMAKVSAAGLPVMSGETPASTRTPRMRPLRSTMAMMASRLGKMPTTSVRRRISLFSRSCG